METQTQLKSVIFTADIFAVYLHESQVLKGLAPSLMAESNSGLFPLNFQEIFMEMR